MTAVPRRHLKDQQSVLAELFELMQEQPERLDGFFKRSNEVAFAALGKAHTEVTDSEAAAIEQAMRDLTIITSSSRLRIKCLADIGCSQREILDNIRRYDEIDPAAAD